MSDLWTGLNLVTCPDKKSEKVWLSKREYKSFYRSALYRSMCKQLVKAPLETGLRRLPGATPESLCSTHTDDSTESSPRRLFPSVPPISLIDLILLSKTLGAENGMGNGLPKETLKMNEVELFDPNETLNGKGNCVFSLGCYSSFTHIFWKKIRTILEAYWSYYSFGWNNLFKIIIVPWKVYFNYLNLIE